MAAANHQFRGLIQVSAPFTTGFIARHLMTDMVEVNVSECAPAPRLAFEAPPSHGRLSEALCDPGAVGASGKQQAEQEAGL